MSNIATHTLAYLFLGVLRSTEFLIRRCTRDGGTPVFPVDRFPWAARLESEAPRIREELHEVLKLRESIPNIQDVSEEQRALSRDAGWKTFFLYIVGQPIVANCARCPHTAAVLRDIPGMQNALFSILAPGKHIPEHRGIYKGFLRFHLGLIVPSDRMAVKIHVDGKPYHWSEGKGFLFDDTFRHEVWNATAEERVILMVDIMRPLPTPLRQLNRLVATVLAKTSLARRPLEKLNRRADVELPQPAARQ